MLRSHIVDYILFSFRHMFSVLYYRMVYEKEASFTKALVASMADLHLLPNGLRKLDKV